jgi:hypothetical protein
MWVESDYGIGDRVLQGHRPPLFDILRFGLVREGNEFCLD